MTLDEAYALPPSARFRVEWACTHTGQLLTWTPSVSPVEVAGWREPGGWHNVSGPLLNVHSGEAVAFDRTDRVLVLGDDGEVRVFHCSCLKVIRLPVVEIA